jgi:hypothetical protein
MVEIVAISVDDVIVHALNNADENEIHEPNSGSTLHPLKHSHLENEFETKLHVACFSRTCYLAKIGIL